MYRQRGLRQRPPTFRIDYTHPLAQGLVFAGLGGGNCAGSLMYRDSSPYGNHGTLTAMDPATDWVWDSAIGRYYTSFVAASSQWISCPGPLLSDEPITMACWYYTTDLSTNQQLMALGNNGTYGYYYLSPGGNVAGDPLRAGKQEDSGVAVGTAVSAVAYPTNIWFHAAATFVSNTSRWVYLNGIGAQNTTSVPDVTTDYCTIGVLRRDAFIAYANGNISDAMFWNRVLSDNEIQQLADPSNVMLSGLILPPKRKLWAVSGISSSVNSKRVMFRW